MKLRQNSTILLFAVLLTVGCSSSDSDNNEDGMGTAVNFRVLTSGSDFSGMTSESRRIELFQDQASLDASIARFQTGTVDTNVDFFTQTAVLISLGVRGAGDSVTATSVENFGDYNKLSISIGHAGQGCVLPAINTQPYTFIVIDSTVELIFEERYLVRDCE